MFFVSPPTFPQLLLSQVQNFGDILQLVIVELIYKVCLANPSERSRFIRCIYNLLNSNSASVRYEAAGTLITLSTAPTAVKAAASCYIDLASSKFSAPSFPRKLQKKIFEPSKFHFRS